MTRWTSCRVLVCLFAFVAGEFDLRAQTACSQAHALPGVFLCAPNPPEERANRLVPGLFHLSAQANHLSGALIRRYIIFLDGAMISQNRLPSPQTRLSLELNLKAGTVVGLHTLRLVVDGAGAAELKDVRFQESFQTDFCDPTGGAGIRSCAPGARLTALLWTSSTNPVTRPMSGSAAKSEFIGIQNLADSAARLRRLYGRNLKSLEADTNDAMALDSVGNLIVATHLLTGIELRKYSKDGSIIFSSVFDPCPNAALSVVGLAAGASGLIWLAANGSGACLPVPNLESSDTRMRRGFVILFDTSTPAGTSPVSRANVTEVETRLFAIRASAEGEVYVAGEATEALPGSIRIDVAQGAPASRKKMGFVALLNPSGSGFRWCAMLNGADIAAISIDAGRRVFVTGTACNHSFLGALDQDGSRWAYLGTFFIVDQVRAKTLTISSDGAWAIAEFSGSPDTRQTPNFLPVKAPKLVLVAVQLSTGSSAFALLPPVEDGGTSDIFGQLTLDRLDAARVLFRPAKTPDIFLPGPPPLCSALQP